MFDICDVLFVNILRNTLCGHVYECIEYYLASKEVYSEELGRFLKPKIYLAYDNLTKETLTEIIKSKYGCSNSEVEDILNNTIIEDIDTFCRRKIHNFKFSSKTVFVEAHDLVRLHKMNMLVLVNQGIGLRCAIDTDCFEKASTRFGNFTIYQDYRVYGEKLTGFKTINHVKKIFFSRLRKLEEIKQNTAFLYTSTDCRDMRNNNIKEIVDTFQNFDKIIVAVSDKKLSGCSYKNAVFKETPIPNFHSEFDTYIYTPVGRKFDCSPRLIAECMYYGKDVIFHDINYTDIGLETRIKDLEKGIECLDIKRGDALIDGLLEAKTC